LDKCDFAMCDRWRSLYFHFGKGYFGQTPQKHVHEEERVKEQGNFWLRKGSKKAELRLLPGCSDRYMVVLPRALLGTKTHSSTVLHVCLMKLSCCRPVEEQIPKMAFCGCLRSNNAVACTFVACHSTKKIANYLPMAKPEADSSLEIRRGLVTAYSAGAGRGQSSPKFTSSVP
jgi:hypothetical protein